MTAEDQKAAKAAIVLDFAETKERYAGLKYKADEFATRFEAIAKILKKDPESLSPDKETMSKENDDFIQLIQDLIRTRDELRRLYGLAEQGGFQSLLK